MGDHHKIVTCGECGQQAPAWKMDTKKMSNGLVYYVCGKNTPNKRMHLTLRLKRVSMAIFLVNVLSKFAHIANTAGAGKNDRSAASCSMKESYE